MTSRRRTRNAPRLTRAISESLENRRLMSLTIGITDADGNNSAVVTHVGQVVDLRVFAEIDNQEYFGVNPGGDALEAVIGAFLSTATSPESVAGNLTAKVDPAFAGPGSGAGAAADLNGDSNTDVGTESPQDLSTDFQARAVTQPHPFLDAGDPGLSVQIGTLAYTVTNLRGGVETDINFEFPPVYPGVFAAWEQGGQPTTNLNGAAHVIMAGPAFTITDPAIIVPPQVVDRTVTDYVGQTVTFSGVAGDTVHAALNLSSMTIVSETNHGGAYPTRDGRLTFIPLPGYTGGDSFTYQISDVDGLASNVATVNITVLAGTDPLPIARADAVSTVQGTAVDIDVLGNDTFNTPADDSLVTISTGPSHGTAYVNSSDGSITYTPTGSFKGTDTFQYTATDAAGAVSAPATVTITVTPPPLAAVDDASAVVQNSSQAIDVLANDTPGNAALDSATVVVLTGPAHGMAAVQTGTGAVVYTPAAGYTGADSFTYDVKNTAGTISNAATVTLNVVGSTPPTAVNQNLNTVVKVPLTIDVIDYAVPGTDGGLDDASIVITTPPTAGTAVPNADGTITYTADPGATPASAQSGYDTFAFTIGDGHGSQSLPATVGVAITAQPTPAGTAVTALLLAGGDVSINTSAGVASSVPLVATSTAVTIAPLHGTTTVDPSTGSILYTPGAGFVGTDLLAYTVTDTDGVVSTPATETVDVGSALSTGRGSPRTLVFIDAASGKQTISLSNGNTDIFFSGNGSAVTTGTTTTVIGTGLNIAAITLTGTTARSALSIRGSAKTPITIGGITDAAPLGSIIAPSATLTGTATFTSLSDLQLLSMSGADLTTTGPASTPLSINVPTGLDSSIDTTQTIRSFRANSWATDTSVAAHSAAITAPVIGSLFIGGDFNGTLSAGTSAASLIFGGGLNGAIIDGGAVGRIEVLGAFAGADLQMDSAKSIVVTGTIDSNRGVAVGSNSGSITAGVIGTLSVRGPFTGTVTAQRSAGSLIFNGGLGGTVTATTVGLIEVVGSTYYQTLIDVGTARSIDVTGEIDNSYINSVGNIGSIAAGYIHDSTFGIGGASGIPDYFFPAFPEVTLANASAGALGSATLGSLRLTSRSQVGIQNSSIFAGAIGSAAVGIVETAPIFPEGIAAAHLRKLTGTVNGKPLVLAAAHLASEAALTAYLVAHGFALENYDIVVAG